MHISFQGLCPSGAELQDWAPAGGQVDLVSHDEAMLNAILKVNVLLWYKHS